MERSGGERYPTKCSEGYSGIGKILCGNELPQGDRVEPGKVTRRKGDQDQGDSRKKTLGKTSNVSVSEVSGARSICGRCSTTHNRTQKKKG